MPRYLLALDQGTTSSRAILFDESGRAVATAQREFQQHYPRPGWVEHDPADLWETQLAVAAEALERVGARPGDVAGIGIANQRETTLVWDRRTGEPVYPAIVWQDRRTAGFCGKLRDAGHEPAVQATTGLVIDAYFSASKVRWVLDHVDGARAAAAAGHLLFGTVDSWLIWKLTGGVSGGASGGGEVHATEPTNASRTSLYHLADGRWDDGLFELFGIPRSMAPQVRPSGARGAGFGEVNGEVCPALAGVPIAAVLGDQQAALFGQRCTTPGMVKNTYGTGCFMLMHTGNSPRPSTHRLLTTAAAPAPGRGDGAGFALEGSVFVGGAVVQWLRDGLHLIDDAAEVEALAASVPDNGGVVLVPAFAGLGAPHWDPYARGSVMGLTRGTTAGHLARAALEGIAFQVADVLDVMREDADMAITQLRVDGGASRNDLLLQFQADLLRVPVVRPAITETTALGAAMLAGRAVGMWSESDLDTLWQEERRFKPTMPEGDVQRLRRRWRDALDRARDWAEHEPASV